MNGKSQSDGEVSNS